MFPHSSQEPLICLLLAPSCYVTAPKKHQRVFCTACWVITSENSLFLKLNWLFIRATIYRDVATEASIQAIAIQIDFLVLFLKPFLPANSAPPCKFQADFYRRSLALVHFISSAIGKGTNKQPLCRLPRVC